MFNSKYSQVLTVILIIVIIGIVSTVGYFVYDIFAVKSKNNKAQEIVDQFSDTTIRKEFDSSPDENMVNDEVVENPLDSIAGVDVPNTQAPETIYMEGYEVMGTIEIPKTGLKVPILGKVTKKSLETSVAILYGVGLNQPGNTTIVGHNYRNGLFFSDNKKLSKNDVVRITDQTGTTITYEIYDIYQTTPSDAKYMQRDTAGAREISLSTCTDDSSARLIILARER